MSAPNTDLPKANVTTDRELITRCSQQPWCTYALHIATFTSLAILVDPLLLISLWKGTADWDMQSRRRVFWAQVIFMFGYTKVIKLVGLFRRNPRDIVYLPVSIIFGYLHGFIKLYALFTLRMVWPRQIPMHPCSPENYLSSS